MSRKKSTRQLIGIDDIKNDSVVTADGELAFYFVHPSNLNVLPEQGVRAKAQELLGVLKGTAELELLALDSRESFLKNKQYYQRRLEEEPEPALRELLRQDMEHLDARQSSTAASREFALVCRLDSKAAEDRELPRRLEKQIQDHGFHVRLAGEQDVKRILAVYYQQDMVTEHFDSIDGERWGTEHG